MNYDDDFSDTVVPGAEDRTAVNPYWHVLGASKPEEIVNFEFETDPYRNFLPGLSSVQAARTVGRGLQEGKRGNPLILAVSLLLLAVLILPALAAVVAEAFR